MQVEERLYNVNVNIHASMSKSEHPSQSAHTSNCCYHLGAGLGQVMCYD